MSARESARDGKKGQGMSGDPRGARVTSSYLIQRLDLPYEGFAGCPDNPFSFGGGMLNGGLSPEAMDLLRGLFSFDYMGAAEFEWGAVPKALNRIAQNADRLAAWSFVLPLEKVAKHWRDKATTPPEGFAEVFVLAPAEWREDVEERIRGWASEGHNPDLKESTRLSDVLRPDPEYQRRTAGWLELDNGFMFFTDMGMWDGTCRLFGVPTKRAPITDRIGHSGRDAGAPNGRTYGAEQ